MVINLFIFAIQIVYAQVNNLIGSPSRSHLYFPAGKPCLLTSIARLRSRIYVHH
jgi:hypothetical protein